MSSTFNQPVGISDRFDGVSADEAEAEAVRMAAELGASDLAGDSMTLSDFSKAPIRDNFNSKPCPHQREPRELVKEGEMTEAIQRSTIP